MKFRKPLGRSGAQLGIELGCVVGLSVASGYYIWTPLFEDIKRKQLKEKSEVVAEKPKGN